MQIICQLLFVIYINDLPEVVDDLTFIFLFADDTKLFRQIKANQDIQALNSDIKKLLDWSDKWLLLFHPDKCKSMSLGKPKLLENRTYTMNNHELEKTQCEKDLGVHVDNNLKFDKHIQACVNKANKIVAIIFKTFDYMDAETFKLLFKSLVRPHLEYAVPVWSPHQDHLIKAIEKVQKRATKRIPGFKDLKYPERLKKLNMPTLAYRRVRGDMINIYKMVHGAFDKEIPLIFEINPRPADHDKKFKVKSFKNNPRKYSFGVRTIELWNSLTYEIIHAEGVKEFEMLLDEHWKDQDLYQNDFRTQIRTGTRATDRYQDFVV